MLKIAMLFLVAAVISGCVGFGGLATNLDVVGVARICFFGCLVFFLVCLVASGRR